jgi:hypothetical protein
MMISALKAPSSNAALTSVLREAFPGYTYKIFGFQKNESILIAKSHFVGVQISKRENDIIIQGTAPTAFAAILVFLFSLAGFASYTTEFKKLEKEVASLLHQKFN